MYRLVSSMLRPYGKNQRYQAVDLTNVDLGDLFSMYQSGYIELSHPSLAQNVFVSLDTIRQMDQLVYRNSLFPTWLGQQGSTTIKGSTTQPTLSTSVIHSSDACLAGYQTTRVQPNDLDGVNSYSRSDMTDAYIKKSMSDLKPLQKTTLTTVNGLLHINVPAKQGLQISGAGTTLEVSNNNHIGLISFEKIGNITQIPFTKEMFRNPEKQPMYRGLYLSALQSLENKSVMVSIMGRLFTSADIISIINPYGAIHLKLDQLNLPEMILESIGHIDLSPLGLDEVLYQQQGVSIEALRSDELITKILTLPQSFIILVDEPNLYIDYQHLNQTGLNGIFELNANTTLPFISDRGFLNPYWKIKYEGYYQNVYRFYLNDTTYQFSLDKTAGYVDPSSKITIQKQPELTTTFDSGRLLSIESESMIWS